jgi:hypothetical protein
MQLQLLRKIGPLFVVLDLRFGISQDPHLLH